jgi:hypothetical protein
MDKKERVKLRISAGRSMSGEEGRSEQRPVWLAGKSPGWCCVEGRFTSIKCSGWFNRVNTLRIIGTRGDEESI